MLAAQSAAPPPALTMLKSGARRGFRARLPPSPQLGRRCLRVLSGEISGEGTLLRVFHVKHPGSDSGRAGLGFHHALDGDVVGLAGAEDGDFGDLDDLAPGGELSG